MTSDRDVGYGRPPKHSQFKKGTSGNPRGRPKGSKNLKTLITRELESSIVIEQSGKKRKIPRKEALVKGLVNDALKGKDRPRDKVLEMVERNELIDLFTTESDAELSERDAAILQRFLARKQRENTDGGGS